MPLLPIWVRAGFDTPEEYAESRATPAPTPAPPPAPVAVPVAAPRSVNKIDAQIARNYLRSMGFDPTGLNAQQLADKLHQITPSEYYEITGWTPDTPAAAPQAPAAPPAAAPAPTPAPVAPVAAEEPPIVIDEVGDLDPESKIAKRRQGFEPVYNPMNYPYPGDKGGFNIGQVFGVVLAVASLAVPGIGSTIGSAILSAVGITGASAAVTTGVGAAALSAANTALQGGSVEDVLKNAAGAGIASGLNIGVGGGVPGAVSGSVAGSIVKGGTLDQTLTNALAAGVGAGIQDVVPNPDAGKIISTAARTYIASGGNVDQTLLNTAATAIGTLDQPTTYAKTTTAQPAQGAEPFKYGNDTYQELEDGTAKVTTQSGNVRILSAETFNEIKQDYASDVAAGAVPAPSGPVIPPQTVAEVAPVVSPTVTDLDLVKQVAEQPAPAVDPAALEKIIVQGQGANVANVAPVSTEITTPRPDTTAGLPTPEADQQTLQKVIVQGQGANVANVAPVEINVPSDTVPSSKTVITPTTEDPFPKSTIEAEKEKEKEAAVVTDLPTTRPDTTAGLTGGDTDLGRVDIGYVTDPFVDIAPPSGDETTDLGTQYINYPVDPFVDIAPPSESDGGTTLDTVKVNYPVDPFVDIDPPTELEKVIVTEKPELTPETPPPPEPPPPEPPPPPPGPDEEKEKPKKEIKKTYPTITTVPPPKKPRAPPIITGASPARLLADALAAYRPSGAIEGEESGKERQNVWNEKSLRLKDALGL